jgi:ribokinase
MKVLNYGSLNIDYVYLVDHFVRAGETLDSQKLELFCGGKGLNQSIALKKSGIDVWHAGAVGENDSDMLIDLLYSTNQSAWRNVPEC